MVQPFVRRHCGDVVGAQQAYLGERGDLLLLLALVDAGNDVLPADARLRRLLLEFPESLRCRLDGVCHKLLLGQPVEGVLRGLPGLIGEVLHGRGQRLADLLTGLREGAGRGELLVAFREGFDLVELSLVERGVRHDIRAVLGDKVPLECLSVFASECLVGPFCSGFDRLGAGVHGFCTRIRGICNTGCQPA